MEILALEISDPPAIAQPLTTKVRDFIASGDKLKQFGYP